MSVENISIIKNIYDKFNSRDYDAVARNLSDGVEWYAADNSPLADQSPYNGIDKVREGVFARIAAGFTRLIVEIDETIEAEDKIIVLGYYDGKFAASGNTLRAQLAHIWTLSEGKIVKFQQYVDTLQIAECAKQQAATGR